MVGGLRRSPAPRPLPGFSGGSPHGQADSGFFTEEILETLERAGVPYAIAARFTNPLQTAVYRFGFTPFAPGLDGVELPSRPTAGSSPVA